MKRFIIILVTLLFSAGVYAQEAKQDTNQDVKKEESTAEFTFGMAAWTFGIYGAQGDLQYDYSHIRVRPSFTIAKENVEGVIILEIDQDFGKESTEDGADAGTDNKVVEVKNAYLKGKDLFIPGFSLTGGLVAVFFPYVVDNDVAAFQVAYEMENFSATLGYIKLVEYSQAEVTAADVSQKEDAQVIDLDVTVKVDTINIRPAVMYMYSGKDANKFGLWNGAVNVTGEIDIVSFDVTGSYLYGKQDVTGGTKYSGYSADAIVYIKPDDMLKIGVFGTWHSGDDADTADKDESYMATMDLVIGAADGRLFLIENGGIAGYGGTTYYDETGIALGLMLFGLNVEIKPVENLTIFVQGGYVSTSEKNAAGDSYLGIEADLRVSYTIASATDIFVEGAYYMAGDDTYDTTAGESVMSTADNGWEIALAAKTEL